jgi:lipopolysaccharide/colanic/teichoic acid biosynthesis glycosyltransferase
MCQVSVLAKRVLDILLACCGAIICLPIIPLICIAIKLGSKGPILFSQMRIGHRGKPFRLYKFRKFFHSTALGGLAVTSAGDKRMTPVGRVLQRTKLDELPQLWNILQGDMSVVGPRPEAVAFADCFAKGFERLLDFKPGLFGPNQVFFRDEAVLFSQHFDEENFYRNTLFGIKARVDLAYFSKANVLLDLWWLMRGVYAVVLPCRFPNGDEMLENAERWARKNASTLIPVPHRFEDVRGLPKRETLYAAAKDGAGRNENPEQRI